MAKGYFKKRSGSGSTWKKVKRVGKGIAAGVSLASKAYSMAKYVAGLVNAEKKFYDLTFSNPTVSLTSPSVWSLSNVPIGDTYNTREGNSIRAKSICCRINVYTGTDNSMVRIILFEDTECEGSVPVPGDVLETASALSMINHTNGRRFRILNDRTVAVNTVKNVNNFVEFYHPLQNHIKFDGTTLREGNLFFLVVSEIGTPSTVGIEMQTRLRFMDN